MTLEQFLYFFNKSIIECLKSGCAASGRSCFFRDIKMKKLIIWDFDGVIADTEKLWVENRLYFLKRDYGVDWDFNKAYKYIGGISERDKERNLQNLGFDIKENFWKNAQEKDYATLQQVILTPYIEDIFKLREFDQCIATGGKLERSMRKIKQTGADKYFDDEHIFTSDMVENGKPEPDLFLLALEKLGYKPEEAMVVEDSTVGVMAAKKAKIKVIAFVKYNTPEVKKLVEDLQPDFMVDDMREAKKILLDFYQRHN